VVAPGLQFLPQCLIDIASIIRMDGNGNGDGIKDGASVGSPSPELGQMLVYPFGHGLHLLELSHY